MPNYNKKRLDLTRQKFGKLTPQKISHLRESNNTVIWICKCDCGNSTLAQSTDLRSGRKKSCGCYHKEKMASLRGDNSPHWRGGLDANGYKKHQGKLEHRIIMEKILNRKLFPYETVHHRNGIRSDNNPKNLELWASLHPKGSKISDLILFATTILKDYAPNLLRG